MTRTMARISGVALALALVSPAAAASHEGAAVPQEAVTRIMEVLADMRCQMDASDIEITEEGGYDLDDVICEGGDQFDIVLDAGFEEVSRRAE